MQFEGQNRTFYYRSMRGNQAYSRLSTTHGHITDGKLDSGVYAGVCVVILMWTCLVWAEQSTPDNFWVPSHRFSSATGEQRGIIQNIYTDSEPPSRMRNSLMPSAKLRSAILPFFTSLVWFGQGSNPGLPPPEQTLEPLCYARAVIDNGMLFLFSEEASSPSMLCLWFDVLQAPVQHVNPGQIPVICVSQPLYTKLKQQQWPVHSQHEEDKFVILFGELHTVMTCYKVLGHWLEGKRVDELKPFTGWSLPFLELHTRSLRPPMSLRPGRFRNHICTVYSSQECIWCIWCHQCSRSCNMCCKCWKAESPQFIY